MLKSLSNLFSKKYLTVFLSIIAISLSIQVFFNNPNNGNSIFISEVSGETVTIIVPTDFDEGNFKQWRDIEHFIVLSNYKVYVLKWQGIGGRVDQGKELIKYILLAQSQGKEINIQTTGNSYSMHAMVLCYVNHIDNTFNYFRMFHADGYTKDKLYFRETKKNTEMGNEFNICVIRGLMTQGDLDRLWQGNEVYIDNLKTWYLPDFRIPDNN